MIEIRTNRSKLKGVIYHEQDIVGVCDNADTFLDILCQIKDGKLDGYRMEVDVNVSDSVKKTYTYKFTNDGRMIPMSYPGVTLWTDELDKKLLYLHNFSTIESLSKKITI